MNLWRNSRCISVTCTQRLRKPARLALIHQVDCAAAESASRQAGSAARIITGWRDHPVHHSLHDVRWIRAVPDLVLAGAVQECTWWAQV